MKNIFIFSLLIVFSVFLQGCSDNSMPYNTFSSNGDPGADVVIVDDLSEDIEIRCGQTVLVESEDLEIYFSDVLLECRCPSNVVCVWEGQAEIEMWFTRPDVLPDVAIAVIRPGRNPGRYPHYESYALDYRIVLESLVPYPKAGRHFGKGKYIATIGTEKLPPGGEYDPVIFTWAFPISLQIDPVEVIDGTVTDDTLTLSVRHSGGCGDHSFKFFARPCFLESYPVQINCYLQHIDHGDPCDAIVGNEASFDIRPIAESYYEGYSAYDDIILNIYGYFTDQHGEKIQVIYSPQ